jgi:hypothetical protein
MGLGMIAANRRRTVAGLSAPVLTKTSAAGVSPMTFDAFLDATGTSGLTYEIQAASATTFASGVMVQDLYKLILEGEFNGDDTVWTASDSNPPRRTSDDVIEGLLLNFSGTRYFRMRVRRDDGVDSPWSNIIGDTLADPVVLTSTNGTSKNSNLTVSGTPALNGATAAFDGNPQMVRATQSATGKKQFEVKVTTLPASGHALVIGIDDGTTSLGPTGSTIPGAVGNTGITLNYGTWGWQINKNGGADQFTFSGATMNVNDVFTVEFDTTAHTISFYRNGTQIGTTVTGLGTVGSTAWAVMGTDANGVAFTANFNGTPAFSHALSSGYAAYGL